MMQSAMRKVFCSGGRLRGRRRVALLEDITSAQAGRTANHGQISQIQDEGKLKQGTEIQSLLPTGNSTVIRVPPPGGLSALIVPP